MFNNTKLDKIITYNEIVISFSYGNYHKSIGGTDKLILAHQQILNSMGISYFYVFPINKIRRFRISFVNLWGVIIDGSFAFICTSEGLAKTISYLSGNFKVKGIFVHHLLGIDIVTLNKIIRGSKAPLLFYIHDYYTICSQINLLKNGLTYCGIGAVSYDKCKSCSHYNKSINHSKEVRTLLDNNKHRLRVILPSESAQAIWLSAYPDFWEQAFLLEHQQPVGKYKCGMKLTEVDKQLRIAYVGAQAKHKGWVEWHKLVNMVADCNITNYRFYHFGRNKSKNTRITSVPVSFHNDGFNAMIYKLRAHEIDCAILWSICPETYSFTYYESMAANTFVITNKNSGNIADCVHLNCNGIVLNDIDELTQLFINIDKLMDLINGFKSRKAYGPNELKFNLSFLNYLVDN